MSAVPQEIDYAPRSWIAAAQQGDDDALTRLFARNEGLIRGIVQRYLARGVFIGAEYDDLYQLACIGFIKAVRGFDPSLENQFSTYAVPKIAGEIRRFLRDDGPIKVSRSAKELQGKIDATREFLQNKCGRPPTVGEIADRLGLPPEEIAAQIASMPQFVEPNEEQDVWNTVSDPALGEEPLLDGIALRTAVAALPARERLVVQLRYMHGLTQQKAAGIVGVSQVQISRIEKNALCRLREILQE